MGAVRIYKEDIGDKYLWHTRSDGCDVKDADFCKFGEDHHGFCNDYLGYEAVLDDLNDPASYTLGGYIKK